MRLYVRSAITLSATLIAALCVGCLGASDRDARIRVATYNIEDVRTGDLLRPDNPRLRAAAAVIQKLRPDVLLVNEITYDQPGVPAFDYEAGPGTNARRFAESFLAVSQGKGLEPISYRYFTAPSNTGIASGLDLDNDGAIVDTYPVPERSDSLGRPVSQTIEQRNYGGDSWGFGTFPGQYGMAIFVRDDLEILRPRIRTFRNLPWSHMPGALAPVDPGTGEPWYSEDEWAQFRLSSKSHWDVPVMLRNGAIVHFLCSHPTPPAFDGPEGRNKRRNHDEIRFWSDYVNGADYIVDDSGLQGGLEPGAHFVILGDLNADPDEGAAIDDPVGRLLLDHPRVAGDEVPVATDAAVRAYPDLDPDDTALFGLRADYVLPSTSMTVKGRGVYRPVVGGDVAPSDHFPVWVDLYVVPIDSGYLLP
jgi:endonuclease/exonuclease/phosphatase family metal-dependent hydrolase